MVGDNGDGGVPFMVKSRLGRAAYFVFPLAYLYSLGIYIKDSKKFKTST